MISRCVNDRRSRPVSYCRKMFTTWMKDKMRKLMIGLRAAMFLACLMGLAAMTFGLRLQKTAAADLLKAAEEMTEQVTQLRSLQPKGPIQKGVNSRDEISKFLDAHVRENYDDAQIESEGILLRKLGMIPDSLDYKAFTLKLLTEQVGGYYDPDKKTFFMADWLPVEQQKPVMAHELTHALQDQYFDIGRMQKEDLKLHNDDRVLAHQAVFEGDAMAVMLDYLLAPGGKTFSQLPNLVMVMRSQFSNMDAQYAVFREAPLFLKEELLFPYGYGAAFLQKIRADQPWEAVNRIYSDLPASTEQIIHPEKYLTSRDDPQSVRVQDPTPQLGPSWKNAYTNVMGEFALYLMLKPQIPEEKARQAAAGWGGDQIRLVTNADGAAAVFFSSAWDNPEDAGEFYQAMQEWFKIRFPHAKHASDSPSEFSLIEGGEYHALRRSENRVNFVVGFPESQSAKLKSW